MKTDDKCSTHRRSAVPARFSETLRPPPPPPGTPNQHTSSNTQHPGGWLGGWWHRSDASSSATRVVLEAAATWKVNCVSLQLQSRVSTGTAAARQGLTWKVASCAVRLCRTRYLFVPDVAASSAVPGRCSDPASQGVLRSSAADATDSLALGRWL